MDLKNWLRDNERGSNKTKEKKKIVKKLKKNLKKYHIAIANIIKECEFNSDGVALVSNIKDY
ncbi:MAG: hypothetical protein WCR67_04610 [Bacilli bacterium]